MDKIVKPDIDNSFTTLAAILFDVTVENIIDVDAVTNALIDYRHVLMFCKEQQRLLNFLVDDLTVTGAQETIMPELWENLLNIVGRE